MNTQSTNFIYVRTAPHDKSADKPEYECGPTEKNRRTENPNLRSVPALRCLEVGHGEGSGDLLTI